MSKIETPAGLARRPFQSLPLVLAAVVLASMPWLATLVESGQLARTSLEVWTSCAVSA